MGVSAALLCLLLWTAVDASAPQTALKSCTRPPHLADGDTTTTTPKLLYEHGEQVEYACQAFYTMQGGPHKTCSNGQWIGDVTCLQPCTVDRDAMTRNNIRFRYTSGEKLYAPHDDHIEFVCKTGRPVGGANLRRRCVNGVINLPSCV